MRLPLLVLALLAGGSSLAPGAAAQTRTASPAARPAVGVDVYRASARFDQQVQQLRDEGMGLALRGEIPLISRDLVLTAEAGAASLAADERGNYTLAHADVGVRTAFDTATRVTPYLALSASGLRAAPTAVPRYGGGLRFTGGGDVALGRGFSARAALGVSRGWFAPATSATGRRYPTSDFRGTQIRLGLTYTL